MSKGLWRILLFITGALACGYCLIAGQQVWKYLCLNAEVAAHVTHWEIVPKRSLYGLKVSYTYTYGGKKFTHTELLPKPYHLNRESAEKEIKKMEGLKWSAWVDHDHPAHSALSVFFPLRRICYSLCLVGIFLYFVYLKFQFDSQLPSYL